MSPKVHLGGPNITSYFLVSGPKFTGLLLLNAGGIALNHVFPILDMLIWSRYSRWNPRDA